MPKVALKLNFSPDVLAAMCKSDEMPRRCPTEYGFVCPFYPDNACWNVTPEDWRAVCLAEEEDDE